jgi:hypothetical protein
VPYHRDDDAGDYVGWSQDTHYYQQERPKQQRNGTIPTANSTPAINSTPATTAQPNTAAAQPQGGAGTQAVGVGIPGRKQRFNEKTTLLSSDDEFQ